MSIEERHEILESLARMMGRRRVRLQAKLFRERRMRALTEPIAILRLSVFPHFQPDGEFALEARDLFRRTESIRATPKREQMTLPVPQALARLRDGLI
jgi:hypothetical protein